MSIFDVPRSHSEQFRIIFEQIERNVNKYINHVEKNEWTYRFNRIFISPGNSFNVKYIIKFLLSKLVQPKQMPSRTRVSSNSLKDRGKIIRKKRTKNASPPTATLKATKVSEVDDLIGDENNNDFGEILERFTDTECFRLLNMETGKRMETLIHQYYAFKSILDNMSFEKLDKLNIDVRTEVPYAIYTEAAENYSTNIKNENRYVVNTVDGYNVLGLLKTCGVVVIDVSRDIAALTRGREIFRSFKREIINDKDRIVSSGNKRLIVVISTVMTWAGVSSKGHAVNENGVDNRTPNPECTDHYEFELEVLAVNKTKELKEIVMTVIVWAGITYGFEQDLFKFAFDSACKNIYDDIFPIPQSKNYLPVIHVENLARLVHKIISETHKLNEHGIFAVETPTYTLKQIIATLGKTCDISNPSHVPLDIFMNKYKLKSIHKEMMSMDITVKSSINRVWPNFKWYDGKPSIIHKMESLMETYKIEPNVKIVMKILVLGPPASGKTKLAHKLSQFYNLMYLEPNEIVQNRIDGIRKELMELRQKLLYMDSDDLLDDTDEQTEQTNESALSTEIMYKLDNDLQRLYSSIDANDGVLEDIYLIPLLKEKISYSLFSKRGYVLDGYPKTVNQAKSLFDFDDMNSQQTDVNKLPNLTVCLKQKTHYNNNTPNADPDDNNTVKNTLEATDKKRLVFSDVTTTFSSDSENNLALTTSLTAKPILKKTIADGKIKTFKGKRERVIWNEKEHNNFLKTLNCYYVSIKTVDSPYAPLDFEVNRVETPELDTIFERHLNIIDKEINQQRGLSEDMTDLDKTNIIDNEMNVERTKSEPERFLEKMTLLEEFEKISDFDSIDSLLTEEYLMKYVTPTLTKLFAKVAEVRPKNAVEFLACTALKKNPEGLPEFPEFSVKGVQIQKLLGRMIRTYGSDDKISIDFLPEYSVVDEHDKNNDEKLV